MTFLKSGYRNTLKSERYQTLTRSVDHLQGVLQKDSAVSEAVRYQDFKKFAHAIGDDLSRSYSPTVHAPTLHPLPRRLPFPSRSFLAKAVSSLST
jgi:hypothetical protein